MEYKPWIHQEVIKLLDQVIKKDTRILEFGSGYSTVYFSNLSDNVISIEHNKNWYEKIKVLLDKKVIYILKEINYISKPPENKLFYKSENLESLLNINQPLEFDIILIDGIDRVNCAYGSYQYLKNGGMLILDDSNRIENPASDGSYQPICEILKNWDHYSFRSNDRNTDIWIKK